MTQGVEWRIIPSRRTRNSSSCSPQHFKERQSSQIRWWL